MILEHLSNADRWRGMHPLFPAAFDFLLSTNLAALEPGRHAIDGDHLFALRANDVGRGRANSPLEAHRKYIDIQYVISGQDEIGWSMLTPALQVQRPYDWQKDIAFYSDAPQRWLQVQQGFFAIFYPQDAHAPLAGHAAVQKIVLKVSATYRAADRADDRPTEPAEES